MRVRSSHIVGVIGCVIFSFVAVVAIREKSREGAGKGEAQPSEALPKIVLEKNAVDMGLISNKETSPVKLKVSNQGRGPLRIAYARGSCPCITAEMDKKTVLPGDSATLTVFIDPFKTATFEIKKSVTIRSNDPGLEMAIFTVGAKFEPEFSLEPAVLDFGVVQKGQVVEKTMALRQMGDEPIELQKVDLGPEPPEGLDITFEKRPESEWKAPGKPEYLIKARVLPEARLGRLARFMKLMTTCKRMKKGFQTAIVANVQSFYKVKPELVLQLSDVRPGQSQAATITITADRPIEVTDPAFTIEGLVAKARPGENPNSVRIEVDVLESAVAGRLKGKLSFVVRADGQAIPDSLVVYGVVRG